MDVIDMTVCENLYQLMKKPMFLAFSLFLVIIAYYYIDRPLAQAFHDLNLRSHLPLQLISALGKWSLYAALFFIGGSYFRYVRPNALLERRFVFLLGCLLIPNVIGFFLKVIVSRARPDLLFSANEFGFYWFQLKDLYWSFPSGHAVTVAALLVGLWVLFPRYVLIYFAVAVLISATRVLLYKHYVSDVLFGFYLGLFLACWFVRHVQAYLIQTDPR